MTAAIAEFIRQPRVLVLAHRGDSRVAPENTLPAFASALQAKADLVELDYLHSADGVPVVFHDETLDRCTDACRLLGGEHIPFASQTLAQLHELDAGGWFASEFAGTRLSTLEEALTLICRESQCMIERKSGDAATCVALLERLQVLDHVVVTSFDWRFLAECRSLSSGLVLGALGEDLLTPERLQQAMDCGASVIGWGDCSVTREHVELVHGKGLRAWVWTVDDPRRAEALIGIGVNGLISNVPRTMIAVRDRMGAVA